MLLRRQLLLGVLNELLLGDVQEMGLRKLELVPVSVRMSARL